MNALQHSLFGETLQEREWDTDSWETPDWLAQKMAALVKPSDRRILEPAAGTGQIVKWLPTDREVVCCEIKTGRSQELIQRNAINHYWNQLAWLYTADFLGDIASSLEWFGSFDLVISNPPFSFCLEFIEQSLRLLNPANPEARILFLLPIDWNSSVARGEAFQRLDCHIHHEYRIMNRVAYLKNGSPVVGRQIYDAVFDIRLGKNDAAVTYL